MWKNAEFSPCCVSVNVTVASAAEISCGFRRTMLRTSPPPPGRPVNCNKEAAPVSSVGVQNRRPLQCFHCKSMQTIMRKNHTYTDRNLVWFISRNHSFGGITPCGGHFKKWHQNIDVCRFWNDDSGGVRGHLCQAAIKCVVLHVTEWTSIHVSIFRIS